MRDFIYQNSDKLCSLTEELLTEGKRKTEGIRKDEIEFLKFLMAFNMVYAGGKLRVKGYTSFKKAALEIDASKANRIFFEKLEMKHKDIIYFEKYLEAKCKEPAFLTYYYTFFEVA